MSEETLRLLTSGDAISGYLIGLCGLMIISLWALAGRRPAPIGGIVLASGGVVALQWTARVPIELLVGLGLLAAAGMIPYRSHLVSMALAIPGGTAVAAAFIDSPQPELVVFVLTAIVVVGPLIARFDAADGSGVGMPALVISFLGVLIIVPDTDLVIVVAAAASPLLIGGHPLRLARIGNSGALAAAGLLMWAVAVGGSARSGTLVAGAAAVGVLVAYPLARLWRGVATTSAPSRQDLAPLQVILGHGGLCLVLALSMSTLGGMPAVVAGVALIGLIAVGYWASSPNPID